MKKQFLKKLGVVLAAALLMATPVKTSASDAALVDLDARVSLTLTAVSGSTRVQGMTYRAWRLADIDKSGSYTVTESMRRAYPGVSTDYVNFTANDWANYASTMSDNLRRDNVSADVIGTTDVNGNVSFDSASLRAGIYLVSGDSIRVGNTTYTTTPFTVSLPNREAVGSNWNYNVNAAPKLQGTPEGAIIPPPPAYVPPTPTTPNEDTPVLGVSRPPEETVEPPVVLGVRREEPGPDVPEVTGQVLGSSRLPQTGVLWWPVPVMLLIGCGMMAYGYRENRMVKATA